jgi:hypothetical protein
VERPGNVVTREELRSRLWPADTFGEFDQGLNTAINKLREALGDSAANPPRFIETLPKRGYRFVHAIEVEVEPSASEPVVVPDPRLNRKNFYILAAVLTLACVLAIAITRRVPEPSSLPYRHFTLRFDAPTSLTPDIRLIAVSPDGKHIAIINREKGSTVWIQDLDRPETRMLEGTENASGIFWSPDSSRVGFVSEIFKLKKVAVTAGRQRCSANGRSISRALPGIRTASRLSLLPARHLLFMSFLQTGDLRSFLFNRKKVLNWYGVTASERGSVPSVNRLMAFSIRASPRTASGSPSRRWNRTQWTSGRSTWSGARVFASVHTHRLK